MWIINNIEELFIGIKAFLQSGNPILIITAILAIIAIPIILIRFLKKLGK